MKTTSFVVPPGSKVRLSDWDPDSTDGFNGDKGAATDLLQNRLAPRIEELQEVLYAQGEHKVLVIFQAIDAGGKDGTIRTVFDGVNPQGVKVASFKKPSPEELAHDYLWRIHARTPGTGEMTIFNRSHYEDVLVVRVHDLVREATWKRRYGHIRDFERMLADEGTTIVKFFLHIDSEEQRQRFQERVDTPEKRWKFSMADLEERKHWDAYQDAFAEMLSETSTDHAPWYVIPSNQNWFRNTAVAQVMVDTLEGLDLRFPDAPPGLEGLVVT